MKSIFKCHPLRLLACITGLTLLLPATPTLAMTPPLPGTHPAIFKKTEFSKVVSREFPISAAGTVMLSNQYGTIDVKTWNKNEVKIDVTILVKAKDRDDAEDVFDRISIDFSATDDFVKAETVISSAPISWTILFWISSGSDYKINYQVFMPETGSLELNNKYGDAFAAPLAGNATVSVKYGSFRMEGVGGQLKLYLAYGNGSVVKAGDTRAEVSYSKISLNKVGNADLTTRYSTTNVDKGGRIVVNSRYDKYFLTDVQELRCDSHYGDFEIDRAESISAIAKYTDFRILELCRSASLDLQYGNLRLEKLFAGFSGLDLRGKYTDCSIGIAKDAAYSLDVVANYIDISYPSSLNITLDKERIESKELRGCAGSAASQGIITARMDYGDLKLLEKE